MSNRCFVFECVYVCVFARGAVAWWGWIELGGWRWISSGEEEEEGLHVGRKLTDTSAVHNVHNVHIFFTAALHISSQQLETTRSNRHQLKLESPTLDYVWMWTFLLFIISYVLSQFSEVFYNLVDSSIRYQQKLVSPTLGYVWMWVFGPCAS